MMQTLPPSPKEKSQDESSQLVLSSPSTGAPPPKMSEVSLDQPSCWVIGHIFCASTTKKWIFFSKAFFAIEKSKVMNGER